jgi:predicted DNA-binding protein (UPF0251 family)
MPKPKKSRHVQQPPSSAYFKPQGIPMFCLEQVEVSVDEYEAIRLVDLEGLDHGAAAKRLRVSRATVARIVESAHRKVAEALSEGKAIRIEGGSYILSRNRFRCRSCGTLWSTDLTDGGETPACPKCDGRRVVDLASEIQRHTHRGRYG